MYIHEVPNKLSLTVEHKHTHVYIIFLLFSSLYRAMIEYTEAHREKEKPDSFSTPFAPIEGLHACSCLHSDMDFHRLPGDQKSK